MFFKSLQVLRTTATVTAVNGNKVPAGTRVVVVNAKDVNGSVTITARVQDPAAPALAKARVYLSPSQVDGTKRGRPAVEKV